MRADDADDLRNRAEEILSRPQFREPEPSLLDRFFRWLSEQLDRILSPIFDALGLGGVGGGMAWLLLIIIAALVLYVLFRAAVNWRAGSVDDASVGFAVEASQVWSAERWRQAAAEHERAGRWDQAVRCHYRATMADLAAARKITDVPGATSGVWQQEASTNRVDPAALNELTDVFDGVWYGSAQAHASDVERARSYGGAVVASVEDRP